MRAKLKMVALFTLLVSVFACGGNGGTPDSGEVPTPFIEGVPRLVEGEYTGTLLLTSNRDRLKICVDVVSLPHAVRVAAKARVEEALVNIMENTDVGGYLVVNDQAPEVDEGCPRFWRTPSQGASDASEYRYFLFVVESSESHLVPRGLEMIGGGDTFVEVTSGVPVTPGTLCDRDKLVTLLVDALGLYKLWPPPTPGVPGPVGSTTALCI